MEHLKATVAFVEAANHGSFTKAARNLDLSPQAVAASIARLETSLGTRLFNRSTRSISLTEEGATFLARAKVGLDALNEAAQSIRDRDSEPEGLVRVSTGAAFGRRYLVPMLPEFCRRYPKVRVDVDMNDRKIDLVRDGYDLVFRGGAIADSSLVTRNICNLVSVMVASPNYLKQTGTPKTILDLHQHRIIMLRFASGRTIPWTFKGQKQFETDKPALVLSDTESVGEAAVLGLGIARVSLHFAWAHLVAGRLKLVLNSLNDAGTREMVIHYPHREYLAPRVKTYVEFCLERLKTDPSLQTDTKQLAKYCA